MNKRAGTIKVRCERIHHAWPRMTPAEQSFLIYAHRHYESEFKRLQRMEQPHLLAHSIHCTIDEYVVEHLTEHPRGKDVTCRRGCSYCCHTNVTITKPEAVLLHKFAAEQGIELDYDRLTRQAQTHDDPTAWRKQPVEDRACTFLAGDGACRVYGHRPDACRKHMSLEDPAKCDVNNHPGGRVLYFVAMKAEIVASAALTVFEAGNMPEMLLKHRPRSEP